MESFKILAYEAMDPLLALLDERNGKSIQWGKNMQVKFWGYMFRMALLKSKKLMKKQSSFGIMSVFATHQ